jgi:hypothetical protein
MVSKQARNGRLCGLNAKGIASEAGEQVEWKEGNEMRSGMIREKAPRVKTNGGKAGGKRGRRELTQLDPIRYARMNGEFHNRSVYLRSLILGSRRRVAKVRQLEVYS